MRYISILIAFLLFPSLQADAQSASEIIHRMMEVQEQQYQNIQDYTLVTNRYTTYYRRSPDSNTFQTKTNWTGGGMTGGQQFGTQSFQHDPHQLAHIAEHAEYVRQDQVDDRSAHVLRINSQAFLEAYADDHEQMEGTLGEVLFYVDTQRHLPLRMEYRIAIEEHGGREISPAMNFADYRQVDGLWIPYRMEMRMDNLDAAMSPEERAELAASLEEMERELREAGGLRRKIVERALGGRMERLREQLAEGMLSYAIIVEDVQVNTGLGDDVFSADGEY